jgi:hypothetical protein
LVALLRKPRAMSIETLIHVGFAHSGTTSLQENFFARRPDIFYCTSVGDFGGIFSYIKYEEDAARADRALEHFCKKHIWAQDRTTAAAGAFGRNVRGAARDILHAAENADQLDRAAPQAPVSERPHIVHDPQSIRLRRFLLLQPKTKLRASLQAQH